MRIRAANRAGGDVFAAVLRGISICFLALALSGAQAVAATVRLRRERYRRNRFRDQHRHEHLGGDNFDGRRRGLRCDAGWDPRLCGNLAAASR